MTAPVTASERDLRALAAIVSQDRPDVPAKEGLPPSLLADLMSQIRCDVLSFDSWDSGRQMCWFSQEFPAQDASGINYAAGDPVFWNNYWDSQPCSYPARTGDLRSVITVADFYSARQWHSTGMYTDYAGPLGEEHHLMVCLPRALPPAAGHTNAQIARRLGISEGTVRTHLENIYTRLNVSSRTAAITRAFPGPAEV